MDDKHLSEDMTSDGRGVLEFTEEASSDQPSSNILETILLNRDTNSNLSSSSLFHAMMKPAEKESVSSALDAAKQVLNSPNSSPSNTSKSDPPIICEELDSLPGAENTKTASNSEDNSNSQQANSNGQNGKRLRSNISILDRAITETLSRPSVSTGCSLTWDIYRKDEAEKNRQIEADLEAGWRQNVIPRLAYSRPNSQTNGSNSTYIVSAASRQFVGEMVAKQALPTSNASSINAFMVNQSATSLASGQRDCTTATSNNSPGSMNTPVAFGNVPTSTSESEAGESNRITANPFASLPERFKPSVEEIFHSYTQKREHVLVKIGKDIMKEKERLILIERRIEALPIMTARKNSLDLSSRLREINDRLWSEMGRIWILATHERRRVMKIIANRQSLDQFKLPDQRFLEDLKCQKDHLLRLYFKMREQLVTLEQREEELRQEWKLTEANLRRLETIQSTEFDRRGSNLDELCFGAVYDLEKVIQGLLAFKNQEDSLSSALSVDSSWKVMVNNPDSRPTTLVESFSPTPISKLQAFAGASLDLHRSPLAGHLANGNRIMPLSLAAVASRPLQRPGSSDLLSVRPAKHPRISPPCLSSSTPPPSQSPPSATSSNSSSSTPLTTGETDSQTGKQPQAKPVEGQERAVDNHDCASL